MKLFIKGIIFIFACALLAGITTYYSTKGMLRREVDGLQKKLNDLQFIESQDKTAVSYMRIEAWKKYTDTDLKFQFLYPDFWNDLKLFAIKDESGKVVRWTSMGQYNGAQEEFIPGYLDLDSSVIIDLYTNNYSLFPIGIISPVPVDFSWTKENFVQNMKIAHDVLAFQELGEKGIMTIEHSDQGCMQNLELKAYLPLKKDGYTNLIITILLNESVAGDSSLESWKKNESEAEDGDLCNTKEPYQLISDKIIAGEYTNAVSDYLSIIKRIGESFSNDL